MRLVDFLSALLQSHARVLRALEETLTAEALLAVLERVAEEESPEFRYTGLERLSVSEGARKIQTLRGSALSPYEELEAAVEGSPLHQSLQFHLWAYPSYRALIESPLSLDLPLPSDGDPASAVSLLEESLRHARDWYGRLPLPEGIRSQADPGVRSAWTWLHAEVQKRRGARTLKSLS